MRQAWIRPFAVVAYVAFLASFTSFAAFVCGFQPTRRGGDGGALGAVAVDLALVALFGVTHSVLVRPRSAARAGRGARARFALS